MSASLRKYLICTATAVFLVSCNMPYFTNMNKRIPIVKVYNKFLYTDEVNNFVPKDVSADDSLLMADNYTRNWITEQLLLHNAEINLSDSAKVEIDKQVDNYKRSLLIYKYKQELVNQQLANTITDSSITEYYNANLDNFYLSTPLATVLYVVLPKAIAEKKLENIETLFRSEEPADLEKLEEECISNSGKFELFDGKWIEVKYLLNLMPEPAIKWESSLPYKKFIFQEDGQHRYLLRVYRYKHENSIAPLDYVKDEIRLILENMNKVNLEHRLEDEINAEGVEKKKVTLY